MSSSDDKPSASNPPRGTIAAICITAAIIATLLWTGLIYFLYQKRKQRLLKQHKRANSLLDPTGAPRRMSSSTGNAPAEKTNKGGLHQRAASRAVSAAAMTPITVAPPVYGFGHEQGPKSAVVSYAMTPTTFGGYAPSAYGQSVYMEPQELPTPTHDMGTRMGGAASFSVAPPPIPDEPIELMEKHYSQQFGKFKAVNWELGKARFNGEEDEEVDPDAKRGKNEENRRDEAESANLKGD